MEEVWGTKNSKQEKQIICIYGLDVPSGKQHGDWLQQNQTQRRSTRTAHSSVRKDTQEMCKHSVHESPSRFEDTSPGSQQHLLSQLPAMSVSRKGTCRMQMLDLQGWDSAHAGKCSPMPLSLCSCCSAPSQQVSSPAFGLTTNQPPEFGNETQRKAGLIESLASQVCKKGENNLCCNPVKLFPMYRGLWDFSSLRKLPSSVNI